MIWKMCLLNYLNGVEQAVRRLVKVLPLCLPEITDLGKAEYKWLSNRLIEAVFGYVTTTTAGTLTFQWSQHTSNATATYIERGSTMILTEV